jgi:hypothetical protein
MKLTEDEILVDSVFRNVRDRMTVAQMTMLNKRIVKFINHQSKVQRATVGASIVGTRYVKFVSRKHGSTVFLEVEKVTPAGIVYGTSTAGMRWKVSANLCTPVDRMVFEAEQMALSAGRG